MDAVPVLVDSDIGGDVDDVLAVAFCALHPGIDLRCVTTVNGDTQRRARLARALLDLLGRPEVPVGAGASVGLRGIENPSMPANLNHGAELIESTRLVAPAAHSVMVEVLERARQPVEICAIGAATNVATTLGARPDLLDRVAGLHLMGGQFGPVPPASVGDIDGRPEWEYNLGCDPPAVALLWGLPLRIRLVPLDVTMPLALTHDDRAAIAGAIPHGPVLEALMEEYLAAEATSGRHAGEPAAVRLHDPLTVVGLAVPEVETVQEFRVALFGPPGQVRTVQNSYGRPVAACRRADGALLRRVLVETLRRTAHLPDG